MLTMPFSVATSLAAGYHALKRTARLQIRMGFAALALICLTSWPVLGQASFSVDRQLIVLSTEPGQELVGSFRVHNRGDEPVPIMVVPVDYTTDGSGRTMTPEAGTTDRSLLPYLVASPNLFTVEPGGYTDVRYAINVPEDLEGSYWIAFLTQRADGRPSGLEEQAGDGVTIRFRFHVVYRTLVVVTVNGTEQRAGRITGLRLVEADDGYRFEVDLINEGNAFFRGTGHIEVRDWQGHTVSKTPLRAVSVLPGQTRTLSVTRPVNGLAPGEYIALAIVDFGGDYLTAGQLRFTAR